ncbi:MAG TPA: type II toxin-antitoxin system VapC family toxin [Minicystis sp.]|nr:type II toxin-antitoxin system VapC family toxin [Minicystis sp.]
MGRRARRVILLDTHVLVWLAAGDAQLGGRTARLVARSLSVARVLVSALSYWEIAMLVAKRRLAASAPALRDEASRLGIVEVPLDGTIAIAAAALDDLHGDPADRLIVATALQAGARLVTADRALLGWRGKLARHDART